MTNTIETNVNRKLKALFVDRGVSVTTVAKALGLSVPTLYLKIRGKSDFTYTEIKELKYYLDLTPAEFAAAFPF